MTLADLNSADALAARSALFECCGSSRWAEKMVGRRGFQGLNDLLRAAEETWWSLTREDWLEAFSAHPRIGDKNRLSKWSANEQQGMQGAAQTVKQKLVTMNRRYEERFGWVFLICATGKSADQMLKAAEQRISNTPEDELRIAAGEQAKIMCLRLQKLLTT